MCINSPDNHSPQYRDLVRVTRGSYRLATPDEKGAAGRAAGPLRTRPGQVPREVNQPAEGVLPNRTPIDDGWFAEARIQAAVVRHLAAEGWDITRVASTASREHGIDIEAHRHDRKLLVEVKGYPDAYYRSGPNAGERKPHGVGAQARTYFGNAVLAGLLMRADHPDSEVVLAFPDFETYRTLIGRTRDPLRAARIEAWTVAQDGSVATASS